MATSLSSALSIFSSRAITFVAANAGLFSLVLGVAGAGVIAFYLVSVPPGTVSYP